MKQHLVITAIGTDRAGILNRVSRRVTQCGCNILDSQLAIYGSEFTLMMLVSGTANEIAKVEATLPLTSQELDLLTTMKRTGEHEVRRHSLVINVNVRAPDKPGIVDAVTAFFAERDLDINSLSAHTNTVGDTRQFEMELTLSLPPQYELSRVETEFSVLCEKLNSDAAISVVSTPIKETNMQTLTAGTPAPDFSLQDQNGETVTLSQFKGKKRVLVYFYPKAMTPGCTTQACSLRDSKAELDELDTVVLGISPDAVKRLTKFVERDALNFTLLSDEDHAVADAFGVWGLKKFMGREYDGIHRISFLVGKDGVIEHVFNKFKTKDHHDVVINYLKGI